MQVLHRSNEEEGMLFSRIVEKHILVRHLATCFLFGGPPLEFNLLLLYIYVPSTFEGQELPLQENLRRPDYICHKRLRVSSSPHNSMTLPFK